MTRDRRSQVPRVHTVFDCRHEEDIDIRIDEHVRIPEQVRGLGKCPACQGKEGMVPVTGVAPGPGGSELVLDSILMMPVM
jgi:hypothetical protein